MTTAPPLRPPAAPARTTPKAAPHPEREAPARRRFTGRPRLTLAPGDREVLWLYLFTRVGIWGVAQCTRWLFPDNPKSRHAPSLLSPWEQWDWWHFLHIAQSGYFPDGAGPWTTGWDNREAFFPGFPLLLRAVHTVIPHWTAAGLLISFVAGAVAVVALGRIARLHLPEKAAGQRVLGKAAGQRVPGKAAGQRVPGKTAGQRAVLFLLLSPFAVFLTAGYTEALFLAFALPAWLAAQRHNWPLAATLACLGTTVRISGLFLAAALAAHFIATASTRRDWHQAPWIALPALPAVLYSWFLHAHTGDWMAWKHAQERGWYREFHAPWEAWQHTWRAAFEHTQSTGYALMCQAELLAMVGGVVLLGVLLRLRRWPEAVYIGLSLWALGTSYWYTSVPRATLLWWPLWTLLATWSLRHTWLKSAYLYAVAPLSTLVAVAFLSGHWAG